MTTLICALSAIGIIGTGIDPRSGILIQELQRGDKTQYLVGNVSAKNVKLSVVAFDQTWRIGQPIGKVLAGPWEVAANSAVEFDASKLVGQELVRFFLEDNTPLGVLYAPGRSTSAGLNGLGSGTDHISVQLPDATVKPGEMFVVKLMLSAKAGAKVRLSPPREVTAGLMQTELQPEKVESKTLAIRKEGDNTVVDLAAPLKNADEHLVELTYRVPEKNPPPLVTFSLWIANNMGGGVTVARGLPVQRP